MNCPLCNRGESIHFTTCDNKRYWKCAVCQLRFLDPRSLPTSQTEYNHYLHHENEIADPRYRQFLQKLAGPLLAKLAPGSNGLDFGCGQGPALAAMLGEAGHNVMLYDPYFYPRLDGLSTTHEFITCTETAEHFHDPAREFERFNRLLKPGGWLAIMTCFQSDDKKFKNWHYRRDPTHVAFYRQETFQWLARQYGWSCEFPTKDVVLMQKFEDK